MLRKEFLKRTMLGSSLFILPPIPVNLAKNNLMDGSILNGDELNICVTCGTRYARVIGEQELCTICADDRQYIGANGQQWTSYSSLLKGKTIHITELQPTLYALKITPAFAIGQQAYLVKTSSGNILWDCIPFIDHQTIAWIKSIGGLKAIAISHPHYYSFMVEWATAFDCPIYLHEADKQWVQNPSSYIKHWNADKMQLLPSVSLIHIGGHFPGSSVLNITDTGWLLTGDGIYIARNNKGVSFMYSYPNFIPLPNKDVQYVYAQVKDLKFHTMYGAFENQMIIKDAKKIFEQSVKRYVTIVGSSN